MPTLQDDYNAFTAAAAFADVGTRTQIEIAGDDRAKFLHNYCTADIESLQPNTGTEAFITSVKGKTLGHVYVYCGDDSLVIETVPGQVETLLPHLERYTLASDVQIHNVTEGWSFLHVGGPEAAVKLNAAAELELPDAYLAFTTGAIGDVEFAIGRGSAVSPEGLTICCRSDDLTSLRGALTGAGLQSCGSDVLEVLRIEAGTPVFGRDITDDNLPQEVNRDARALNLTKGCYLGQETVARLDALGHVNKLLVGVNFDGETVPADGTDLLAGGKVVGKVTSAVFSLGLGAPLALAYVRTGHCEVGSQLDWAEGNAEVVQLPVK